MRSALLTSLFLLGSVACAASTVSRDDRDETVDEADASDSDAGASDAGRDAAPSGEQRQQAAQALAMLDYIEANTAYPYALDYSVLRATAEARILSGDGSEATHLQAMYGAFLGVPQGHQGFQVPERCGDELPYQTYSRRGVCGRPHGDGIIVTVARSGNPLGLHAGDVLRFAGGSPIHEVLAARPMCASSMPSTASAHGMVAATVGDLVQPGDLLKVTAPDGSVRDVTVGPQQSTTFLSCADPLGRPVDRPVYAETRADGVAVIRLPSFVDPEQPFPEDLDAVEAYREEFVGKILAAFDSVKNAPKMVWDIRGNGGGLTAVGLEIASGFAGAQPAELSYCTARIPDTSPPEFSTSRYASYALTPGGRFAYAGKVAVLIDELDYSAADYFPLGAKLRTSAILVGHPTSGAFGASSASKTFDEPLEIVVTVDTNRCVSAADGEPLETKSVEPHTRVDYAPADLAAGRDTVLEAAVRALE